MQENGWYTVCALCFGDCIRRSFYRKETPRVGSAVALAAKDAIDLANALKLDRFAVIGHDWGARAAFILAALFPERISWIAALSLGYQPRGFIPNSIVQPIQGAFLVSVVYVHGCGGRSGDTRPDRFCPDSVGDLRARPIGFGRQEFACTAENFSNPDWVAVALNAYRSRWRRRAKHPIAGMTPCS